MDRSGARALVVSGRGRLIAHEYVAASGELRAEGSVETGGDIPSFAALHPGGRLAYVVNEGSDSVAVIDLEAMALLSVVPSGGGGPAHVSVLPNAAAVAVANYGGGTVTLFALDAAGTELTPRRVLELGPNPHAALAAPGERFLVVPALGADAVFVVPLAAPGAEPRRCAIKTGSGPRHLAFDPLRPRAYLVCEHTSELAVLDWRQQDGWLEEIGRVSLLPPGASVPGNTGADVHVHPNGRFLYATNRGHDSLAVFALDDAGARLVGHQPTRGSHPRNFALGADGDVLLAANLRADSVGAYRVDAASGALEPLALNQGIEQPFWVGFVPPPRDA